MTTTRETPANMTRRRTHKHSIHPAEGANGDNLLQASQDRASATKSDRPGGSASRLLLIFSMLTLGTSAFGVFSSLRVNRDASVKEAIDHSFAQFMELADIQRQDWRLSHMFQLEETYADTCKLLETASEEIDPALRAEMLLREHGIAEYIFAGFQSALWQWRQANETGDPRAAIYKDVVDYYTGRLLRNPRLVYWWMKGDYGARPNAWIRKYYDENVVAGIDVASIDDTYGPYGR